MAGLSEKMISALCVNNTLTSLKLARNGLGKVDFTFQNRTLFHNLKQKKNTATVERNHQCPPFQFQLHFRGQCIFSSFYFLNINVVKSCSLPLILP